MTFFIRKVSPQNTNHSIAPDTYLASVDWSYDEEYFEFNLETWFG